MIGCLRTRVCKQPIIALYFEFETVLKFYNLEALYIKAFNIIFAVITSVQVNRLNLVL